MSQAQAAAAVDRLPWLEDEPKPAAAKPPRKRPGNREIAPLAIAGMVVVAGAAYWMGAHSSQPALPTQATRSIPAPRPKTLAGPTLKQPEVVLEPEPEVRPAPVREVPIARPRPERRYPSRRAAAPARHETRPTSLERVVLEQKKAAVPVKTNPDAKPLTLWPAPRSDGARGRIVRIGAFGTRQQAKLGWRHMVRAYPAVAHLPATVVEVRNSRGRPFYRFQIGTTSQAHSEVLCQRMGKIRFSCAVVGLPWKPKGVER
jgi:hypothetical protein